MQPPEGDLTTLARVPDPDRVMQDSEGAPEGDGTTTAPIVLPNRGPAVPEGETATKVTRKSSRTKNPTGRLIVAMMSEGGDANSDTVPGEIFVLQTMFSDDPDSEMESHPLLGYKATSNPDTLYLHQAMKGARQGRLQSSYAKGGQGPSQSRGLQNHTS
jgi:hypothetical protein